MRTLPSLIAFPLAAIHSANAEEMDIEAVKAEPRDWLATIPIGAKRLSKEERRDVMKKQFPPKPFIDPPRIRNMIREAMSSMHVIARAALAALIHFMACMSAQANDARRLIDEIVREPGYELQACSFGSAARPAPVPVYGVALRGQYLISAQNFSRLREARDAVVRELTAILRDTRLDRVGENGNESAAVKLSQHQLVMLIDLNAVETLPELLRIECELHGLLERKDGPAKLPEVSYDGGISFFSRKDATEEERDRIRREVTIEKAHRDVLGVVTAILRQERFSPLLDSEIESDYRQVLEAGRPSEGRNKALTPNQKEFVAADPLYDIPVWRGTASLQLPYDSDLRERIVSFAARFLETVPAERRRGAAGMIQWPVTR